ncbi:hypothetical protein CL655_00540 [bacterium]|nr:hypothetical protein [bacterium]|tara:strand:+ start:2646 stop:3077 length:432 start_codon:yes stop_codon:yes gene_type:complete
MFLQHSVTGRLAVGKTIGFLVGGVLFFLLPALGASVGVQYLLGLWLTYIMMGAVIGFMGVMTEQPVLHFKMPFWLRGGIIGGSFHLLLVLLSYEAVMSLMQLPAVAWLGFTSPYWIIIDGIVLGILMGWAATKISGEGELPLA